MALSMKCETPFGLTIEASYVRIIAVGGTKINSVIEVFYFVNQQCSDGGKEPLIREYYNFSPSVEDEAPNFIKQGYEYLKTLPEFETAVDVLE